MKTMSLKAIVRSEWVRVVSGDKEKLELKRLLNFLVLILTLLEYDEYFLFLLIFV